MNEFLAPTVTLEDLALDGPHDPWIQVSHATAPAGEVTHLTASPGVVTSALALAISGRLRPVTGTVSFDGLTSARHRRQRSCLIDVEDVTAPDDGVDVRSVLAEELVLRGQRGSAAAVDDLLRRYDCPPTRRWEQWPPDVRTASLIDIAAMQPPSVLIVGGPDRHGGPTGAEALWREAARRAAEAGHTVIVISAHEGAE